MSLGYFYAGQEEKFHFIRIPDQLFSNSFYSDLSDSARILYGILLDRTSLSRANQWYDEENRVFVIYKVKDIMIKMNCASEKAIKLLAVLSKIGLIERYKGSSMGSPDIIYVKNFADLDQENQQKSLKSTEKSSVSKIETPCFENRNASVSKIETPGFRKSKRNSNTEYNKTDLNETESIFLSDGSIEEQTRRDVEESKGIPEAYYGNPELLGAAIKVICDAEYMREDDSSDAFTPEEVASYDRIVQAMIDMSTANRNMPLNGSIVTYRQFISLLNRYYQGCGCDPAKMYHSVLHMSEALLSAVKTYQPKNLSAYTKSFVWQRLSDMPILRHTEKDK